MVYYAIVCSTVYGTFRILLACFSAAEVLCCVLLCASSQPVLLVGKKKNIWRWRLRNCRCLRSGLAACFIIVLPPGRLLWVSLSLDEQEGKKKKKDSCEATFKHWEDLTVILPRLHFFVLKEREYGVFLNSCSCHSLRKFNKSDTGSVRVERSAKFKARILGFGADERGERKTRQASGICGESVLRLAASGGETTGRSCSVFSWTPAAGNRRPSGIQQAPA